MMTVSVQMEDFDLSAEVAKLRQERNDVGAIVTFTGTVRDMAKGAPIRSMTLEHYPGMTEKQLEEISQQAQKRWPVLGSTIIHRYGELLPGDNIVLVAVLSSHRQEAFEAAEFLMDFLKNKAPFWKKETPLTGAADWVDARESDQEALLRWREE